MAIKELIKDRSLQPYFFDLFVKNYVWDLSLSFGVSYLDRIKAQKDFYISLHQLSEQLKGVVPEDKMETTIAEVSNYLDDDK
jgi:hypothetical protein